MRAAETALEEIELLVEMAEEAGEEEVLDDLKASVKTLSSTVDKLEFQVMLGGAHDR